MHTDGACLFLVKPPSYPDGSIEETEMERLCYKPIAQTSISPAGCFIIDMPAPAPVKNDAPALSVMTDLTATRTVTILPDAPLQEAYSAMQQNKVHQLIVALEDGKIAGILTSNDRMSEKSVLMAAKRGIKHDELLVRDIMTPVDRIDVLRLSDVTHAEVGHIVVTLKAAGRMHAVVVEDRAEGGQRLRGIFSALQIARLLGVEVLPHETARTFAEIEAAIGAN